MAGAGRGVVRGALVVRLLDEWWSYLPAGTIDDQVVDLGLSYRQSALLLALLTIGGLAGSPIAALADRGHRRLLASSAAVAIALGLTAFALAAPFAVLVIAATVMGGASDVMIRPLESALADAAERAGGRLDRLLGRQHLLTWCGDVVAPVLLALGAVTVVGWRGVFAITAGVFVVFAVTLAATSFPDPRVDATTRSSLVSSARSLLRRREVWLLAAAEALLLPLDEAFLGFAVARAATGHGAALAQMLAVGLVAGGIAGSALIARRGIDDRSIRAGGAALVTGACVTAAPLPILVQAVGLASVGVGTAMLWAKVHHRTLTLVPGRSAMVPTVVGVLATPAVLVVVAMGATADAVSITVALVATAVLAVPLVVVVTRLGGRPIRPDELDDVD